MIQLLLIVIGCYVIAAAGVHCFYYWEQKKIGYPKHYVLIANEPSEQLEWYYLSMQKFSRWMGISVRLTFVQSTVGFECKKMIECWNRRNHDIQLQGHLEHGLTNAVIVDLNREEDLCKLPF